MAITDKIYVKNHRQLSSQLDTNIPKGAFKGATMDILFNGGDSLDKLDETTRERVLDFAKDFMDCGCDNAPYCGHPERKFISYLLELRAQGMNPGDIVDVMGDDYMVYAYEGDILSFLDDGIRTLEAMEELARVDGNDEMRRRAKQTKENLSR
ncbi:DUF5814 domain-containing protein [Haloarchaeobius sp. DT45]|uniref:DUF5814 domain-containing protein n=1 Tax=Haloarchaeobius sp. DT45 TaxID=3446116 RepID=UPI003F6BF762